MIKIMTQRIHISIVCGLLLAATNSPALAQEQRYLVGSAKLEITPDFPTRLAGYASRREEVSKVEQPIFVRAIAIGDESTGGAVLLVNVETCGFSAELVEQVCREITKTTKVPRDRIAVCSTHTHSAPWVIGNAPFISMDKISPDEYLHLVQFRKMLTVKIVKVAVAAFEHRKPATLSWGKGHVGFASNRRVIEDGKWRGFGISPDGPTDRRMPVLVAKDGKGKPVAVLMDYACHCTTLGGDFMAIAGDWAGHAQANVEEMFPGSTALVVIGCGADANPNPRGSFELCQKHGQAIAAEVKRLVNGPLTPVQGAIRCRLESIDLPLEDIPGKEHWEAEAKQGGARAQRARHFLELLNAGESIPDHVRYPVGTWAFGDSLGIVFLGGEVVADYAVRMDIEFDMDRMWVVAYANDVPCYIPSKRLLEEGGYETDASMIYYGQPTRFRPEVEDLIIDTVQRLLTHGYYSKEKQQLLPPAKTPMEALKSIQVPEGLRVELVAAEPLVVDPVAFDWGPDGSLWVVEMRDYPNGLDNRGKPGGRIKVLHDEDNDGRYDSARVFLDGLTYPTGVKVWRKGILITAAPDILYAEDRTGDGQADFTTVLYHGFGEGNQQHRVNGLRYGLDNWIYVGNGDSGGQIRSKKTGALIAVGGRDLRIRPDTGGLETQSGQTQYGRCQDDWGNWFGGNNSLPMWHFVIDEHYARRNKNLRTGRLWRDICDPPGAAAVYPASRTLERFNDFDKVNRFTSACSPSVYRDHLLGKQYYSNVFVCEPVHDLVFRGVMKQDGYSFRVTRAPEQSQTEFFAADDNWSRPVMARTGPDGAVWIADMYRFAIEHPEWIPIRWRRKIDVRAGENRGRIYRVVPAKGVARPILDLTALDAKRWVQLLSSPNGWTREMVQQLIIWRADRDVVPDLNALVQNSSNPLARIHAIYTLSGLDSLDVATLLAALRQTHPGVLRHAIRLSEPLLDDDAQVLSAVLAIKTDHDPQLRMQLAYSLGECQSKAAAEVLGKLISRYGEDVWFRKAALSSLTKENIGVVIQVAIEDGKLASLTSLGVELLEQATAFGDVEAVTDLFKAAVMLQPVGVKRSRQIVRFLDSVAKGGEDWQKLLGGSSGIAVQQVLDDAIAVVTDDSISVTDRIAAMALLGRRTNEAEQEMVALKALLHPQVPLPLQTAAVGRLSRMRNEAVPNALLANWRGSSPGLRNQVLDALFARTAWTLKLLDAMDQQQVRVADLGAARESMLFNHQDSQIRKRAERLLSARLSTDRDQVVRDTMKVVAKASPNQMRGKQVFAKRCASCHELQGVGHAVGPDLIALTNRSTDALLTAILDPNRALEDRFQSYAVATTDGRVMAGLLTEESSNSVTLLEQDAKRHVILRSEILSLASTGKSLMPEGIEKDVPVEELADVVSYLQSFKMIPKSFPGNQPQLAPVRDDGSFRLFAIHARIYGPSLVYEPVFRNLGYWQSQQDLAAWDVKIQRSGKYRIYMTYACEPNSAGNRYVFSVQGQSITGIIDSTGGWDKYGGKTIGTVELTAGTSEIVMRSDGPVRGALCDLKVIRLIPTGS